MARNYIVMTEMHKLVKNLNCRISSKAVIIVNCRVEELIKIAAERARINRRITIMPQDV